MKNMKRNVLLVPFLVAFAMLAISFVSAANVATNVQVEFNNVALSSGSNSEVGFIGEVVPVRVHFDAIVSDPKAKIEVHMEGHRDEVSASTSYFALEDNKSYNKLLSLRLPSDLDDIRSQEFTLYVEIYTSQGRTVEEYTISVQRDNYVLRVLSVDYTSKVAAGDVLPVSVVIKNEGYADADDVYVVASIPALGISSRGYVGDLVSVENDNNGEEDDDAMEKTVYLKIPEMAESGVYEMEVVVFSDDSQTSLKKLVSIGSSTSTMILATNKNKNLNSGESTTYEMVIVNSGKNLKVFNLNVVSGSALVVEAPSAVAVGPDSTQTVSIMVTAPKGTPAGTYTFSVSVDGQQTVFGANVAEGSSSTSVSLVAWTVVLIVVFVVLLAVLLVLVTRKEKPVEEVETSYY